MIANIQGPVFPSRAPVVTASLWALTAVSSFVLMEPAPYDLLALGMCVFFVAIGLRVPSRLAFPIVLLAVMLLANSLSILFAPPDASLRGMLVYAALTAYMAVVWLLLTSVIATDPDHVIRVLWNGWIVAAVIATTLGIVGYFRLLPGADVFVGMGRAKATFKDPNVYGPFLVPVALYAVAKLRGGGTLRNLSYLALFLYISVGVLIGFSRGAWGNMVASLLVFAALTFFKARSLREYMKLFGAGGMVVMLSILLVAGALATPKIGGMLAHRANLLHKYDVEAGGRFDTQRTALREIARNPIGIGPNRTIREFGRAPHNVYLKITSENGWIAGLAFVAFLGLTLWTGLLFALRPGPLDTSFAAAYASTVGIVAESVIIDTLHWRHYFVLLAFVWGAMMAAELRASRTRQPA